MSQLARKVEPEILESAAMILSERLSVKVRIEGAEFLSEPERRNLILRIEVKDPEKGVPKSLILKQAVYRQVPGAGEDAHRRFSNDWAGLAFVDMIGKDLALAPRFFGGSKEHGFVLIEDLGVRHLSLVEPLTRTDRFAAEKALQRYSLTLARFHGSGFGRTDSHDRILRELNPARDGWQASLDRQLADVGVKLSSVFGRFKVPMADSVRLEVEQVIQSVIEPGPFTTLIHGDICPDNVFDDPENDELKLIDFEWAWVGSALLDSTFLRMGMPTCWCAKIIPDELIDSLEASYRRELVLRVPVAGDDRAYFDAYVNACAFWALRALDLLNGIMEKDPVWPSGPVPEDALWKWEENRGRARFISRLRAFKVVCARYDRLPHLRQMADNILVAVTDLWPDAKPMDPYPAFTGS